MRSKKIFTNLRFFMLLKEKIYNLRKLCGEKTLCSPHNFIKTLFFTAIAVKKQCFFSFLYFRIIKLLIFTA